MQLGENFGEYWISSAIAAIWIQTERSRIFRHYNLKVPDISTFDTIISETLPLNNREHTEQSPKYFTT